MVSRNTGQYIEEQLYKIKHSLDLEIMLLFGVACFGLGINFTLIFHKHFSDYATSILTGVSIILITILYLKGKKLKSKELLNKKRIVNFSKGLEGEKKTYFFLSLLQGENSNFYIINDFQNPKIGNIDHIVISEKGIFAIETKKVENTKYIDKAKKQTITEAYILRNILHEKFGITWVTPILCFDANSPKEKIDSSGLQIVNNKNIGFAIQKSNKRISPSMTKEVFLHINSLQQKDPSD